MHQHYPRPVIIGSGLTGLLISLALSKAQVGHILIGGPPSVGSPRLGESLNLNATIYLLAEYPEMADCFFWKEYVKFISGDLIGGFHLSFVDRPLESFTMTALGHEPPHAFLHVDRTRLDAALYEKAVHSPYCVHMDARVSQFLRPLNSDLIEQVVLEDGGVLPASHVFDATGHIRLVARQMHVQRRMLGAAQQVTYVHYHRQDEAPSDLPMPWRHGTTLMRLYHETDGVDAMAWCIPMGNRCSVGISTSLNECALSAETLLARTRQAFARHGIDYRRHYDRSSRIARAKMEFYTHARAYGANWLLASAAHSQIQWMSAVGLDTSVAAAEAAVPFLTRPEEVGNRYQEGLKPLTFLNDLWTWASTGPYGSLTEEDVIQFENQLAWSVSRRWLNLVALEERGRLSLAATSLLSLACDRGLSSQAPPMISITRVRA